MTIDHWLDAYMVYASVLSEADPSQAPGLW